MYEEKVVKLRVGRVLREGEVMYKLFGREDNQREVAGASGGVLCAGKQKYEEFRELS